MYLIVSLQFSRYMRLPGGSAKQLFPVCVKALWRFDSSGNRRHISKANVIFSTIELDFKDLACPGGQNRYHRCCQSKKPLGWTGTAIVFDNGWVTTCCSCPCPGNNVCLTGRDRQHHSHCLGRVQQRGAAPLATVGPLIERAVIHERGLEGTSGRCLAQVPLSQDQ